MIKEESRKNPYGGSAPLAPASVTMLNAGFYLTPDTLPMETPTSSSMRGCPVHDWSSVHVTFYADPSDYDGLYMEVIPWRWYPEAPEGYQESSSPKGRWIADRMVEIALDPDMVTGTRGEHECWDTRNASKMYWQITVVKNADGDVTDAPSWIRIQPYGYTKATSEKVLAVTSGGSGGESTPEAVFKDVLANGRILYSTETSSYAAARVNGTTISVLDGATPLPITAVQIVAIALKLDDGTQTPWRIYRRGDDLDLDYDPVTGYIVVNDFTVAAADEINVYWEDYPRALEVVGDANTTEYVDAAGGLSASSLPTAITSGRMSRILTDIYHRIILASHDFATQADSTTETMPLNDKCPTIELVDNEAVTDDYSAATEYFPSSDGGTMDSWKDLSFHIYIVGGIGAAAANRTGTVTLEVSSGMEVGGNRQWDDISLSGYVCDADSTINNLGETSLISSTGNVAASRVIDFDNLNIKYWRLAVDWDAAAVVGTPGSLVMRVRRKAL